MRVETTTRELYTFDELTETAKERAIELLSDINVYYEWWDCTYEDANTVGITITSFELDRNRHACATICNPQETAQLILENHGIECETYKTAKAFLDEVKPLQDKFDKAIRIAEDYSYNTHSGKIEKLINILESEIEELEEDFKQSITEDYSIMLQHESDYLQSSEAIEETIRSNEYEFTIDGELA